MIEWFNKKPGDDILTGKEEPILMIGDTLPDWVRLPAELGGAKREVLGGFMAPCPRCCAQGRVKHLRLTDGVYVAECSGDCGFVWYNRKDEES